MGNVDFYLYVQGKNALRTYKHFLKKTEILRNMVGATLPITGAEMLTYKASPMHCRNQYRAEHMLSQIINNY